MPAYGREGEGGGIGVSRGPLIATTSELLRPGSTWSDAYTWTLAGDIPDEYDAFLGTTSASASDSLFIDTLLASNGFAIGFWLVSFDTDEIAQAFVPWPGVTLVALSATRPASAPTLYTSRYLLPTGRVALNPVEVSFKLAVTELDADAAQRGHVEILLENPSTGLDADTNNYLPSGLKVAVYIALVSAPR